MLKYCGLRINDTMCSTNLRRFAIVQYVCGRITHLIAAVCTRRLLLAPSIRCIRPKTLTRLPFTTKCIRTPYNFIHCPAADTFIW